MTAKHGRCESLLTAARADPKIQIRIVGTIDREEKQTVDFAGSGGWEFDEEEYCAQFGDDQTDQRYCWAW